MNDTEQFLTDFQKKFMFLKGKKIAIYGIGVCTAMLLNNIPDFFDIIGLLDKDEANIGKDVCGKRVIDINSAMTADAIIIVTQYSPFWEIIYNRISSICDENDIPVYYTNGVRAQKQKCDKSITDNDYWNVTIQSVKEKIDVVDVVSFDIFDTLIMRKVYYPYTIFSLVEFHFFEKFGKKIDFTLTRKKAENEICSIENTVPDLEKIYEYVKAELQLTSSEASYLCNKELELEKNLITARKDVVDLYLYAKNSGKQVYLISDMYLNKLQIKEFLVLCGIDEENLVISSEQQAKKSDGSLWKKYKALIGEKKALHIGDDDKADIETAAKEGIAVQKIYSSREMLEKSSLSCIVSDICNRDEEVMVGIIISHLFNSPFSLSKSKGVVVFDSLEIMGTAIYAMPIYNYLVWLSKSAVKENNDQILFFARDGYFLSRFYNYIAELYGFVHMPKGIYFPFSRMFGIMLSIRDEQDICNLIRSRYCGKFKDFMRNRFFISVDDDPHANEEIFTAYDYDKILSYVKPYYPVILQTSSEQRKRFLNYISSLQLKSFCVSDASHHGTNQFYLSKLLNKKFMGYYMIGNLDPQKNTYDQTKYMKAIFQNDSDIDGTNSIFYTKATFFEDCILVAPEGSVIGMNGKGEFIHTPKGMTQKTFYYKELIADGIKAFIADICKCYNNIKIEALPFESKIVCKLFEAMMSYKCEIESDIRSTFYCDTFMTTSVERKIWE